MIEIDASKRLVYLIENGSWHYRAGPRYIEDIELIDFAQRDGFVTTHDLFTWFRETHGRCFVGILIEWRMA